MNDTEISAALEFATGIVEQAGQIALGYFRRPLAIENKLGDGLFDPVTVADREIEHFLGSRIRERFPDHGIVGEEHGILEGRSRYSWIIDPIDGTRAFISGVPAWGILLGLRENERCIAGVVHQPYLEETFCGSAGQGWLLRRGERRVLACRREARLADAILYCTHPGMFGNATDLAAFQRVAERCRLMRYGGDCYAYCLLAAGHLDLVIETELKPHDVAALIPIVRGAGGIITTWEGGPPQQGGRIIAAGDARIHEAAMAKLKG